MEAVCGKGSVGTKGFSAIAFFAGTLLVEQVDNVLRLLLDVLERLVVEAF